MTENYDAQLHRSIKGIRGYRRDMVRLCLVKLTAPADTPPESSAPPA